jgi:HEAT repeat protein
MMSLAQLFQKTPPDISALEGSRDIAGLIRQLSSREPGVQTAAAGALARIGPAATVPLVNALKTRNRTLRLGLISALADIRDPRALDALEGMTRDSSNEIRWQACIALGEMGEIKAVPALLVSLRDKDKYVRYASALSLLKTGYQPATEEEWAFSFAGMQDWEKLAALGTPAVPAVVNLLSDSDAVVRQKAIQVLGSIGSRNAEPALLRALADEDRNVRWEATLASQKCGVPPMLLPRGLCQRPRLRKNPLIAGFLNFLLPGLGYGYLGKWWGIMIFQIDITVTVWLFKYSGESNTYSILFPLYLLLGAHAWYITKMMPEEAP